MSETLLFDPILARFRAALDELYGDSLERVVLFGSRTRRCAPRFGFRLGRLSK